MNDKIKNSQEKDKKSLKITNRWSLKQRILYSLLLSVTASLTIFVFGPINIFGNNTGEFSFVLGDFIGYNILYATLLTAAICAILIPMRGVVFEYAYGTFFALTVALFLQGNYLNFGLHSLGADGDKNFKTSTLVVNTLIWIAIITLVILAVYFLRKKKLDLIKTVSTIALITVFGMQVVTTLATALTTDVFMSHDDRVEQYGEEQTGVLTFDHLTEVSSKKNIIYFVIDRFDWRFYEQAKEECPEVYEELNGFTVYEDAMSLYPYTYPSVCYMLTGKHRDWNSDIDRKGFFEYAYQNSDFLKLLKDNNYRVNLYTDRYYGYEAANPMDYYIYNSQKIDYSDYRIQDRPGLSAKMSALSMYRHLPFFMKNIITVSTGSFWNNMVYDTNIYEGDMKKLYNALNEKDFTTFDDQNNFSFIHFTGTHTPFLYDEDFNEVSGNEDVMSATKQSFKIINRYLKELKRLGLYDDATIVITGDHGWDVDESYEFLRSPPIFFKESGSTGEMKLTSAPVTHENLFASIFNSEKLDYDHNSYAKPLSEIHEGDKITRTFYYTKYITINGKTAHEIDIYEVNGSARDPKSWQLKDIIHYDKNMYD